MNSICRALVSEPGMLWITDILVLTIDILLLKDFSPGLFVLSSGVETKFGVGVGLLEWLEDEGSWSLNGIDGQNLGHFKGVVASDKNVFSPRFTNVTGRPPPLGMTAFLSAVITSKIQM